MNYRVVPIRNILIVGGGTAGWMTAAALAKAHEGTECKIQLVESEQIGTVGVGEATIPSIAQFNQMLGLDENELMAATQATFKLGIEFVGWGAEGESYIHPFSTYGKGLDNIDFHHWWLRLYNDGKAPDLEQFSLAAAAARAGKFARMAPLTEAPFDALVHAFQFDASLYARYLRTYAEARGVDRVEGRITSCKRRAEDGFITSVQLEGGAELSADLFIDCSGFRSLLLGQELGVGFEDWSHWLPCNRAVAVASENPGELRPYTRSTARSAGWQWQIPLQHRAGNGHVFCDEYIGEDQATETLLCNLPGSALGDPKLLRFTAGRRHTFWEKNCVAVGLSAGFLEPLESTSIHLIQTAIQKLLALFPSRACEEEKRRVFNQRTVHEYEKIRDFLILHYCANKRPEPFWRYCAAVNLPDHLAGKLSLYRETGHIFREDDELFSVPSWLAVLHGQGIRAHGYHPLTMKLPEQELIGKLEEVRGGIQKVVNALPRHQDFIARYCASPR